MTVRINKPALNLREELTKAQGVVRYEQRQFWFDTGLVENGTFENDVSGWLGASGGSLNSVNNKLALSGGSGDTVFHATQYVDTTIGATYQFSFTAETTGTRVSLGINTYDDTNYSYAGGATSVTTTFVATASRTCITLTGTVADTTFYFDDIKMYEVDNTTHVIPLGFKPVHVYEDGLLQREGENYDYTVVDTGFEYQIKPAVTPSATTETCVIAEREL